MASERLKLCVEDHFTFDNEHSSNNNLEFFKNKMVHIH